MITYTSIIHKYRQQLGLSCHEYILLDIIYSLHTNPLSMINGWCYAKKDTLAEYIGLSKRGVLLIIDKLIDKGFIIRDEETRYLKTTEKWQIIYFEGEKSSPEVKKVHSRGEKSSLQRGEKSSPHNIINSINNLTNNHTEKDFKKNDDKIELPFKSESFKEKWTEWREYRKEKRLAPYKPIGLKKIFQDLIELSAGDEQTAVRIIEQSMRKNWQGFFSLKNGFSNGQQNAGIGQAGKTIEFDRL